MLETVDIADVKAKLYERLKPSGWGNKLKTFLLSEEFDKVLHYLLKDARDGKRFTPQVRQMFRAFEECKYDDLKIVMIGQDPYPQPLSADGIAFSCSNTGRLEASLRYVYKEVEETVYKGSTYSRDPDLKKWSNQGILLVNCALSTTIGKVGQHYHVWQPFLAFLFDILMYDKPGLIYVFMGKKAQEWMDSVPDNNIKIACVHPAAAAHRGDERWDSGDLFNRINQLTEKHFNTKIIW